MKQLAALVIMAVVLAGCSTGSSAKGPVLVTFEERRKATIEPLLNSNTYSTISEHLSARAVETLVGGNVAISETILNDGRPSKGVRITIKGPAVSDGILSLPLQATARGIIGENHKSGPECQIQFREDAGGWQGICEDVEYGSQLEINIVCQAIRGGQGEATVFVYPLDKNGKTSAVSKHAYKVLSEAENNEIQVPVDQ